MIGDVEQGVLQDVLGIVHVLAHPHAEAMHRRCDLGEERLHGCTVALTGSFDERVHGHGV